MNAGVCVSNLVEAKHKVQGLPGNLQQFPQVNLNKKQLKTKVKGTNDRNIVKPFIMRTYLHCCTPGLEVEMH